MSTNEPVKKSDALHQQADRAGRPETKKSEVALQEERILAFWQDNDIFQKTLAKPSPKGDFVFYDGPPFATGLPHYGHLLPGTIKDVIPRYKTMRGYHVPRRWGWDCHGLPIENLIEKELDLPTKKHIEDYGIEKFNEAAKATVLRYESEWKNYVPRSGRWVDMENPYMSMQPSYMESVWWVFSQLYKKGLTKEGFKPMHLCPRCETTLANFEVNQGYEDVTDISVTAKFELIDEPGTYLLAWTTTPWTLPGNVALGVGENISYVKVSCEGNYYLSAKDLLGSVFEGKEYQVIEELKGKDLIGKSYRPIFDYYQQQDPRSESGTSLENRENGWKVYAADFVTTEEGTGIVHIAPAFGSDDMNLGKEYNLPFVQHVNKSGAFIDDFAMTADGQSFKGMLVKKKDDHTSTDIEIIKRLAADGTLFAKKKLVHSYPHCWRCGTPLLNYATTSWYVSVPDLKDRLLENNQGINWVPDHVGEGRFGKWLEGARDWALSRSRFWGTPLPVWQSIDGKETFVPGSIDELLDRVKTSGNTYLGLRHGQAHSNVTGTINADPNIKNGLTEQGLAETKAGLAGLPKDIDLVFVSPLQRTCETADIIKAEFGLSDDQIIVDDRLRERSPGKAWEGKPWHDAHAEEESQDPRDFWNYRLANDAESIADIYRRTMDFMFNLEENYQGKTILIISHGGILKTIQFAITHRGEQSQARDFYWQQSLPKNADILNFDFKAFPHNRDYMIDLHRPYIDDLQVIGSSGEDLTRVEDVFDVWFDSGSMPYAQAHYPFENKNDFLNKRFPANFIAEGLDQTRGWFYVLSVLGTALFDKIPFKNVVVNGLVLAEDGKKMSKSLKNYPDMNLMLDSVGADALRLFLVNSPLVRGEEHPFSEKVVREVGSKVMGRLRNILNLYQMYKGDVDGYKSEPLNVLDMWIISCLGVLEQDVREGLETYELDRATRPIFDFVDDFSTWYIRRSRERFKGSDIDDKKHALGVTRRVLRDLSKIMAPFAPFIAEEIWQEVRVDNMEESVHLSEWPEPIVFEDHIIKTMAQVRSLISEGLQLRSDAGIKVRQPLGRFTAPIAGIDADYLDLVRDELNVKEVSDGDLAIDMTITDELRSEGQAREFLRQVQDLRKKSGLDLQDMVKLYIQTSPEGQRLIESFADDITSTAGIREFTFTHNEAHPPEADARSSEAGFRGEEITVDDLIFILAIEK
ncbi:class I tRNA ligase family protein [Patescibacteria group bacterium]|nr:class I tRNA ligase family protein [Patescibacteria group bacterium]